jgi:hypothetical protein
LADGGIKGVEAVLDPVPRVGARPLGMSWRLLSGR